MPRPDPYVPRNPNDLLRSTDWNEIQVRTREDVQNHNHSGGEQGVPIGRAGIALNAIDGTRVDPASTLTVTGLTVSNTFRVGTRTLISEVDALIGRAAALETRATNLETRATNLENRATNLEGSRVLRAGDTMSGALRTPGVGLGVGTENLLMPLTIRGASTDEGLMAFQNRAGVMKWHINQNFNNVSGLNIAETGQADGRLFIKAGGNVGISTVDPKHKLHVEGTAYAAQGNIANGVVMGRNGTTVNYEYAYESIGVTESNMNLRLQSPNSIVFHAVKGETVISKWLGGTGHLTVEGIIKGPVTRPVREQLVHSRILHGMAGDAAANFTSDWTFVREIYGPFSYALPGVQSGARRRYRAYALYTDNVTQAGAAVEILIEFLDNAGFTKFTVGSTWGWGSNPPNGVMRDCYSNWEDRAMPLNHARLLVRTTQPGTTGQLRHLTLQAWDFFE